MRHVNIGLALRIGNGLPDKRNGSVEPTIIAAGKLTSRAATLKMNLRIVSRRNPDAFEVLPRRWVVERTFAWISKHRRTVRDYEHLPASHEAMILWAMTALMTCRLAQPSQLPNTH